MSERPSPGTTEYLSESSKRPSIEALRKQVEEGANIYTVIEGVLHRDADALFDACHFGTQADEDLMNLYGLKPTETYSPFFIDGFRSAANSLYSQFVELEGKDPKDLSGETWLKKRLGETFGGKGPGLDGASKAIRGAARLYQMITGPVK